VYQVGINKGTVYLVSELYCSHLLSVMLSQNTLLSQRIKSSRWPENRSTVGYHAYYVSFATHGRANYSSEVSYKFGQEFTYNLKSFFSAGSITHSNRTLRWHKHTASI